VSSVLFQCCNPIVNCRSKPFDDLLQGTHGVKKNTKTSGFCAGSCPPVPFCVGGGGVMLMKTFGSKLIHESKRATKE
jgi:hypothetical protein